MGGQTLFYDAPSRALIPQTGFGSVLDANGFFTGGTVDRSFSMAQAFAEQNHALISNITGEFNTGRITGAKNIDFQAPDFEQRLEGLDKSKSYLVHCASGGRSSHSLILFKKHQFQSVYHLDGGIKAWTKAGLSVEK